MQQEWVYVIGADPDFSGTIRLTYADDLAGPPEVIPLNQEGREVHISRVPGKSMLSPGHGLVPQYEILDANRQLTDFELIFQHLSDRDRTELATRSGLEITDALANRLRTAGMGLTGKAVGEMDSGALGSGRYLTPAFDSYLSQHGIPRAAA